MNSLTSMLTGTKILAEIDSPVNGHLVVKKDLAWGTYIQADGTTQSGGVVENVWKSTLGKFKKHKIESVLILGLGGGTIAKVVRKYWPKADIVGMEIDPVIVDLGNQYLGLARLDVNIIIDDAAKLPKVKKYDLICIDLYLGDKFPEKFASEKFIKDVSKSLNSSGVAIFNRLYGDRKRGDAVRFMGKLESVFTRVDPVYPEANVMFVCKN